MADGKRRKLPDGAYAGREMRGLPDGTTVYYASIERPGQTAVLVVRRATVAGEKRVRFFRPGEARPRDFPRPGEVFRTAAAAVQAAVERVAVAHAVLNARADGILAGVGIK